MQDRSSMNPSSKTDTPLPQTMGTTMKRLGITATVLLMASIAMTGCNQPHGEIIRVQTNLVDKSIFEGEWWIQQTAVAADAAATGQTWAGDSGWGDLGVDADGLSTTVARVRWVVDEDYLYAYRAYELIAGGNDDGRDPGFRGQPLAAFRIETHADIRNDYNTFTGETTSVVLENTSDRRWYERQYMRVDWSQNVINSFTFSANLLTLGGWQAESAPFFIQEDGSHPDFPAAWNPQFVRVSEDPGYRFADEWPADMQDAIHYMSFVTVSLFSPGANCLFTGGGRCQTYQVPMRLAFLRIPPEHEYASASQSHDEFDRFGVFRTWQRTYVRGSRDTSTLRDHCDVDADCGAGGHCDTAAHVCYGGLTSDYGETDMLTFYRPRHNFYARSFRDDVPNCLQDWECDGRYADTPGQAGSVCDVAARRCTIPVRDREIRQVAYYLNDGHPAHLVRPAFEVVGNWNEVFMRGHRASIDQPLPNYADVRIACQSGDPTSYCWCGSTTAPPSGDVDPSDMSCAGRYDVFKTKAEWEAEGVVDAYDCHVENTEFTEPANPGSYADYSLPGAYRYQFVGSECMFVLRSNSCDWYRTDAATHCDDVLDDAGAAVDFEQLGDIRYQFYNYVNQSNTPWGGVAYPLSDVINGELVAANINYSAGSVESVGTLAVQWFPVLRCANETLGCAPGEENAEDEYWTGDNARGYFSRQGRTERAFRTGASGADGFTTSDYTRPGLPVDRLAAVNEFMEQATPRIERLRGMDGRLNILSDRMQRLAGTHFESDLMESMGSGGRELLGALRPDGDTTTISDDASILDPEILDQVSPFRGPAAFGRTMLEGHLRQQTLGKLNMCTFAEDLFRSRYWEYWAEAFRGAPISEASIRVQQLYSRMVMHHEMGHSVGLRHNFGASYDRNNYGDGYFNIVLGDPADPSDDLLLPDLQDFNDPARGGDGDPEGYLSSVEFENYYAELRRVRNERARRGASNYMTGSTMDYNGDTSDAQGLGRYDVAATIWNYFDMSEAYVGDPEVDGLHHSHSTPRVWWRSYRGGEACDVNTDCPNTQGSVTLASGQPVFQRCIRNPRYARLPEACGGDRDCVCSSFTEDFKDYQFGAADYNWDADGDGYVDHTPASYLFCSDMRTNDISWCNRQDAGESFQEQVDHYRRRFEETYGSSYYRRNRAYGARGGNSIGMILDAAKIYQHLFFRYFYEPSFRTNYGPLGILDQFNASMDVMNWFIELANLPDQGSYACDPATNVCDHLGEDPGMVGSDFSLEPGQGYGMWTKYQEGYFGFFRAQRSGVFLDKYFALLALAIRDWGLSFTLDERYYINFVDLFPLEMTEFFGGLILDEPRWFAPRVDLSGPDPVVQHMGWDRGLLFGTCDVGGQTVPCRGSMESTDTRPAIGGTSNHILRSWATILSLAQFPVFYDTSFEQRLLIYKRAEGTGFSLPAAQPDGQPTCAYGAETLDPAHRLMSAGVPGCQTVEDTDYVVYESDRFHTQYIAVKVKPRYTYNLEEEQLGFQLLSRLHDRQQALRAMAPTDPGYVRARADFEHSESFLEYLIDLQAQYGISNTLF